VVEEAEPDIQFVVEAVDLVVEEEEQIVVVLVEVD